jgi:CO/xanthine dehydrogenase Mo-binding subunit
MLHGAILRSPHAHAVIIRVDASRAALMPGVVAVLTGDDVRDGPLAPTYGPVLPDRPLVAFDRVRFAGEPVAAVAAVDRDAAAAALGAIEVEYDPLPSAVTAEEAAEPDAPVIHDRIPAREFMTFPDLVLHPGIDKNVCNYFRLRKGDVDVALRDAAHVFAAVYRTAPQQHGNLEPHVTLAQIGRGGATIWTSSAAPFTVRAQVAETLRFPAARVRVIVPNVGGAYGAKTYPRLEPLVAALSWKTGGRPVRVELTRAEEFYTICRHAATVFLTTGVDRDGVIVARKARILWAAGAYADISPRLIKNGGYSAAGPYRIPNVTIDSYAMYTNTTPAGGFRGYGVPQVAWAYERQMDEIAADLGIDSLELRRRNLVHDGDTFATGQVMEDIHLDELLDDAAGAIGWPGTTTHGVPESRIARGRGLACIVKTTVTPSTSTAGLRLEEDGSLTVLTSTVEVGQGSRTVLAQIAADAVGVDVDRVRVTYPDTATTPWDQTTSSSRSTLMMGGAIRKAGDELRRQIAELASDMLEVAAGDVVIESGRASIVGSPDRSVELGSLVRRARAGNLLAYATNRSVGSLDPETGQGIVTPHFYQATAAAEVDVDLETGHISIVNLQTRTWAGRTVHPTLAELQGEGNMVFGAGQALFEEVVYDGGQIVNANLADYQLPSIRDLGPQWTAEIREAPAGAARIHGLGESGAAAVPAAIGNAVADAIGAPIRELPLRPERILETIRARRTDGAGTREEVWR